MSIYVGLYLYIQLHEFLYLCIHTIILKYTYSCNKVHLIKILKFAYVLFLITICILTIYQL